MTITREQLQKAAKAAGIKVEWVKFVTPFLDTWYGFRVVGNRGTSEEDEWNPLHDHGQLHDLAMACKICIDPRYNLLKYSTGCAAYSYPSNCQDFPALAEAVILACCEQIDVKGGE